jgi:hypothetical protein
VRRGDRGRVADGLWGVLVRGGAVGAVVGAVDLRERECQRDVRCRAGKGKGSGLVAGSTLSMASRTRVVVMRPLRKRLLIRSAFVAPLDRQAMVRPRVKGDWLVEVRWELEKGRLTIVPKIFPVVGGKTWGSC